MIVKLVLTASFEKRLSKYIHKHPDMESKIKNKLNLFVNSPYALELKNHKLSGKLDELRAIVISYDCRLVFQFVGEDKALLIDIGKHDEVY